MNEEKYCTSATSKVCISIEKIIYLIGKRRTEIPQKEVGEKTYAQIVANVNKNKERNNGINRTLQLMLSRLDRQEERLTKLEYSNKGLPIPKTKQK